MGYQRQVTGDTYEYLLLNGRNLLTISASRSGYFRARWVSYPADITSYYWLITRTFTMHNWIHFLLLVPIFLLAWRW